MERRRAGRNRGRFSGSRYLVEKNFNDPVLDELIDKATEQNLGLQIAGLRVYEARALLSFAAGTLYPQSQTFNGSASTARISENADPVSNLPPGLLENNFNRYGTSLEIAEVRFRNGVVTELDM